MSSLAGAAVGYDKTLGQLKGPVFVMKRWSKDDHYFDRLRDCARSSELVHELVGQLGITPETDEIFIAQEEPIPYSMIGKMQSGYMKQQIEISGAFLGGLLRFGYNQLAQISHNDWRGVVARDLGITTHYSKWKDPALVKIYNCKPADTGKFRAKQWAMLKGAGSGEPEIPDWPDIISSKDGKIPRPEGSKAKAIQPDDRYDALAIMQWMVEDLERGLVR